MNEQPLAADDPPVALTVGPSIGELSALVGWLSAGSPATDDAGRIDRIAALERLKQAASAAQAVETVVFKASQLLAQQQAGMHNRDLGKGIVEQIALARHESPGRTGRLVGLAEALVMEMPATLAALRRGDVSEWRALQVTRETAFLASQERTEVDAALAPRLGGLSDRETVTETQRLAYALDPQGFVSRGKKAHADRHVSMRPAPDTMARFSALLPAAQGVALYAALVRAADTGRAHGDCRSRGQLMADALVERVTGQAHADQVPVEVQLVMTDRSLFGFDEVPAVLVGYGPIPTGQARDWLRRLDPETQAWLRRLYTDPTGQLSHLDTRRRLFRSTRRTAILIRDQHCRTPWCSAAIRHVDHAVPAADGGPTSARNGQGLCEACNQAKRALGWRARPDPVGGAGARITITTPTGHTYTSIPPPLPGSEDRWRAIGTDRHCKSHSPIDLVRPKRQLEYAP